MYCPSCSSQNQGELKFCTRCGTNLGVVSDAMTGRSAGHFQIDERMVKLFTDYYSGRNAAIIGSIAIAIALLKAVIFAFTGLPAKADFLGVLATVLLLYGIVAIVSGLAKWNSSASEIKAIERAASQGSYLRPAEEEPSLLSGEPARIRTGAVSTDPIGFPGSVTEQTTRQLDERGYAPLEREQDRSR